MSQLAQNAATGTETGDMNSHAAATRNSNPDSSAAMKTPTHNRPISRTVVQASRAG